MNSRCCGLLLFSTLLGCVVPITAQANPKPTQPGSGADCPQPALSRLIRHKVAPGETLESIAQQYNLIPATLMGMNPALQNGKVAVRSEILVPPYNGIRVAVPPGQTLQQVAERYKIRSDVLFEVNGCQTAPKLVFVPGVNWSPQRPLDSVNRELAGYPLPSVATVALGYGWQLNPETGKVFFHSGLDLLAAIGTPVKAIGAGTVAFAGEQGTYGNLVVLNHQGGKQSRYAHLQNITVKVGQTVKQGDLLGTVGATGKPTSNQPHLHFEMRYASSVGWVAEDPASFLKRR
jgi:lysostaphin